MCAILPYHKELIIIPKKNFERRIMDFFMWKWKCVRNNQMNSFFAVLKTNNRKQCNGLKIFTISDDTALKYKRLFMDSGHPLGSQGPFTLVNQCQIAKKDYLIHVCRFSSCLKNYFKISFKEKYREAPLNYRILNIWLKLESQL